MSILSMVATTGRIAGRIMSEEPVTDSDGNTVGTWKITDREES